MNAGVNTARVWRALPPGVRNVAPIVLTLVCAGVFAFLSGGYILTRSAPVAIVYLLLAAVWVWFLRRRRRPSLLYLVALAAFGVFVAWSGISVLWSIGPDLSRISFDIAALYLAVAAVVGVTPMRGLQLRVAGCGLLAIIVAIAVYAFLGKVTPDLVQHAHTYARLDSPVGYWNVLALMMVMGFLIVLALAGDRRLGSAWRVLAAAAAVPLAFTFFFTLSRGGWVVLCVALLMYFALTTTRLASFATLVAIVVPVALALKQVQGLETLFTATADDALRTLQGHTLLRYSLAAVLVTAGGQALIAILHKAVPWPRWLRVSAAIAVLCVLAIALGGGSWRFLETRGGVSWLQDRASAFASDSDETYAAEGTVRLVSVNTGRPPLWREALEQSRHDRLLGAGAGTFPLTHYRFRTQPSVVKHAHSQWLNVLSELGVVGLVLLAAALALLVAAAIRNPFADRGDPLRPLLVALQTGMVAFVVHISWDWDWDMAAIGVLFFLLAGVCASYLACRAADVRSDVPAVEPAALEHQGRGVARWPLCGAASLALALLAVSWLLPYLSATAENTALTAAGDGDTATALVQARRAARFDPLAVSPLITESLVLQQEGDNRRALEVLEGAARLQPDNYEVHYAQGVLLLNAYGRKRQAVTALKHALELNPLDVEAAYELRLALGR